MRIFVTGASGYIGSAIVEALVRGGHEVTGLVRNSEKAEHVARLGGHPLIGDLSKPESYREGAQHHAGVVHAANANSAETPAVDRLAIDTLLAAAHTPHGPRVFVYTSGIWVLPASSDPMTEDTPVEPTPLAAWRAPHEQFVLDACRDGLRTVVVRPGIVYGGHRGIVGDVFRDASNGLVRMVGNGENHWPTVYVRDLADLYVRLVTHPEATGIYHANDEGDERMHEIVDAIVAHVPHTADVRRIPLEEARTKMGPYALALALDQVVRSPRAKALGWNPTLRSVAGNAARLYEEWRVHVSGAAG